MKGREAGRRSFGKAWILVCLGIVVVTVAGGAVYLAVWVGEKANQENYVEANYERSTSAQTACKEITDQFATGKMYFDDAVKLFEEEKNSGDSLWRMFFAMCYARFVVDNGANPDSAVGIIDGVDVAKLSASAKRYYFLSAANIYSSIGDEDMYEYYIGESNALGGV